MDIILIILAIVSITFVLNIIIIQSNNFIFVVFRQPMIWVVFMGLLSFLFFFIGSKFDNSFNIVWWSAFLAFIVNIPSKDTKTEKLDQKEKNEIIDTAYTEMGIKKGRLKYRLGLVAYLVGGILGWIIFYGQIVAVS